MDKGTRDKGKRQRPERGAGGKRRIAAPPSESAWGWGPARREKSGSPAARRIALALFLLCICLFAVSAFAQQPPTPPDGFVPASSLPNQEQLPAAPLVIAAYSIVWLLVLGYVWSVWNRIARAERELADVSRRIGAGQRR